MSYRLSVKGVALWLVLSICLATDYANAQEKRQIDDYIKNYKLVPFRPFAAGGLRRVGLLAQSNNNGNIKPISKNCFAQLSDGIEPVRTAFTPSKLVTIGRGPAWVDVTAKFKPSGVEGSIEATLRDRRNTLGVRIQIVEAQLYEITIEDLLSFVNGSEISDSCKDWLDEKGVFVTRLVIEGRLSFSYWEIARDSESKSLKEIPASIRQVPIASEPQLNPNWLVKDNTATQKVLFFLALDPIKFKRKNSRERSYKIHTYGIDSIGPVVVTLPEETTIVPKNLSRRELKRLFSRNWTWTDFE